MSRRKKTVDTGAERASQGMPFSLVGHVDTDPVKWLETLPQYADMLVATFEDGRPDELTTNARTALRTAVDCANSAKKAIALGMATEAAYAAMRALQSAWMVEALLGFVPRIARDGKSQKQRRSASSSAASERQAASERPADLARDLAAQVSPIIRSQGKAAVARKVRELAAKSQDPHAQYITERKGNKQLIAWIFPKQK